MIEENKVTITIPLQEYIDLRVSEEELACLECAGVDNWEGYADSFDDFNLEEFKCQLLKNLMQNK